MCGSIAVHINVCVLQTILCLPAWCIPCSSIFIPPCLYPAHRIATAPSCRTQSLTHARASCLPSYGRRLHFIMTRGHEAGDIYIHASRYHIGRARRVTSLPVQSEPFWYVCARTSQPVTVAPVPPLHPKAEAIPLAHLLVHPPPFLAARGALFSCSRARSLHVLLPFAHNESIIFLARPRTHAEEERHISSHMALSLWEPACARAAAEESHRLHIDSSWLVARSAHHPHLTPRITSRTIPARSASRVGFFFGCWMVKGMWAQHSAWPCAPASSCVSFTHAPPWTRRQAGTSTPPARSTWSAACFRATSGSACGARAPRASESARFALITRSHLKPTHTGGEWWGPRAWTASLTSVTVAWRAAAGRR